MVIEGKLNIVLLNMVLCKLNMVLCGKFFLTMFLFLFWLPNVALIDVHDAEELLTQTIIKQHVG